MDSVITIITTIHPAKKGKRAITILAAPEGEMPVCRTGLFADRHQLADQAFGELLKRKPQVVKKPKTPSASAQKNVSDEDDEPAEKAPPAKADQVGPAELKAPDDLPDIEGDKPAQLELEAANG